MNGSTAKLLSRYAAVRGLRPRVLRQRWETLPARTRATLAAEMTRYIARHEAAEARRRTDAAFESVLP